MKIIRLLTPIVLTLITHVAAAQFSRYIIRFTNKTGTPYSINNPAQFLSTRALERRARYNIAVSETDLPVNPAYLDSIASAGNVTILNVSKWFNQVCIRTTDAAALARISAMPFVQNASPIAQRQTSSSNTNPTTNIVSPVTAVGRPGGTTGVYSYGSSTAQIKLNNIDFLHNRGFTGQGMQLAVMDAGFLNYLTLPTFDSARRNNQILGTWDFVANEPSVNEDNAHGMFCLSTIAANLPGTFVGTAPKASFYLYRTEDAGTEYPIEEQNFAAAAERADSLGVDLFSISLGYYDFDNSIFNYSYSDMNGRTTLIARAVNMAFQKGIMVVVAAGNEGNNAWRYIATPGDADEALTVGAVNINRAPGSFSSYGPSSDGQVKPDVAAVGVATVIANTSSGMPTNGNGTSFATPIMAGLTTCLWQAFPEEDNVSIREALRQSGDRFTTPNDRTGYGIADAKKAFVSLLKKRFTMDAGVDNNCQATINWTVKTAADIPLIVERRLPAENSYTPVDTLTKNTTFSKQVFQFTEDLSELAIGATVQYRLKMQVASDTSFYLDSVSLTQTSICNSPATKSILVSPNPATDMLTIRIAEYGQVKVSITMHSINGQQVYQLNDQLISGSQTFRIPVKSLSSGVYAVTIWIDGKKEMVKQVVKD